MSMTATARSLTYEPWLESLPGELVAAILDHCTCATLSRLGLTNFAWAKRIVHVMTAWWQKVGNARRQWVSAGGFDELEALHVTFKNIILRACGSAGSHRWCSHDVSDLTVYREAEAFADMQAANNAGPVLRSVNAAREESRLEYAKKYIRLYGAHCLSNERWGHGLYYDDSAYCNVVLVASLRLSPPEFHDLVCALVSVPMAQEHYEFDLELLMWIGKGLRHSLKCAEWSAERLVELAHTLEDGIPTLSRYTRSMIVSELLGQSYVPNRSTHACTLWLEKCWQAVCILKPPAELDNQRFWFEFTTINDACEDFEYGYVFNARYADCGALVRHAKALPVSVLSALVDIVGDEEYSFWEEHDRSDYYYDDVNERAEEDRIAFTCSIIIGWAEEHLLSTSATHNETDRVAFIALLSEISTEVKGRLCATGMKWVAAAAEAGDLETVKSIANALK